MSKLFFTADWHLSHKAVTRFRPQFTSVEEHNEFVLDRCKTVVSKRDVIIFVGDIAFSKESLAKVNEIECLRKILVLGNHCTDYNHITSLASVFDHIHGYGTREITGYHIAQSTQAICVKSRGVFMAINTVNLSMILVIFLYV